MNENGKSMKERRKIIAKELSERADTMFMNKLILPSDLFTSDHDKLEKNAGKYKKYAKSLMLVPILIWIRSKSTQVKFMSIPICFGMYYIISDYISYKVNYSYTPPNLTKNLST